MLLFRSDLEIRNSTETLDVHTGAELDLNI